jgi:Uma2 family endonuclease
MNVHTSLKDRLPETSDEFLIWNEGREGRREFVSGRVVEMMINVSFAHYRLANRLQLSLASKLDDLQFVVGGSDFGVKTSNGLRYPDVMILRPDHDPKALATASPLLIAEILSPSTMANDFGAKATEYLALDSLRHYLVLAQDARQLWLWSRKEDGSWTEPELHDEGEVVLKGFGISLDLPTLYAAIA